MQSVKELDVNVTATVTQGSRVGTVGKYSHPPLQPGFIFLGIIHVHALSLLLVLVIPLRVFL